MKVCLIDADSIIPNLALMKLSSFFKKQGDEVQLLKANLPYFPNRKKVPFIVPTGFDSYFASIVFEGNKCFINENKNTVIYGGTGVDLKVKLPQEVESLPPDYSIYPDNDVSYGFISRGCVRNCSFCVVPEKEGKIQQVATVAEIVKHKKVKFLDNNFLALPNHKDILKELAEKKIKCTFNQGLDIRLLDEENSKLLSKLNYWGEYIFAFDDWNYLKVIEKKCNELYWRKPFQIKFYMFVHPEMELSNICKRISWAKKENYLPYVMRSFLCWEGQFSDFYVDLAAYCNQVHIFKSMDFYSFLEKRHKNKLRIDKSAFLWSNNA